MKKQGGSYHRIEKPWLKYYPDSLLQSTLPQNTIYGYIYDKNINQPNRIAIEYFGKQLSYSKLFERIDQCASALASFGIGQGDIVSICMPTTPEFVFLFYALSKLGAVSNMIDPRKSAKELEECIKRVHSKMVFCVDLVMSKLSGLRGIQEIKGIVIITPFASLSAPIKHILWSKNQNHITDIHHMGFMSWNDFFSHQTVCPSSVTYKKDMAVTIVYTGGTTGKSKGVILSNDTINSGAYQCEHCGFNFSDRGTWLDIMPPFIAYGVGNGLHLPLSMGMKVILMPKFDPSKFDQIIMKHRPNYMASVPSHYGYIVHSTLLKNADLSFLKAPIVGGDKMDNALEKEVNIFLQSHNCESKIIKGYGMSEVNAAVSVCTTNQTNKLQSVGIPLSHSIIQIRSHETGEPMPWNEIGEIWISGPNVMLGYFEDPIEEAKVLDYDEDGNKWIRSGDIGYMDEDGNLFIKGRYKEMIVRADGFKVYPNVIEEVILQCSDVSECKVVGYRDSQESQGELPKAYIKLKTPSNHPEQIITTIKTLCEKELAEYSQPHCYEIVESFPMTPIGKIDTLELKRKAEERK